MEKANFGQIVSFLFGIANDCLVDTYDVGDYRYLQPLVGQRVPVS